MSGHSKWSTIKHKKGKADAARGKVFTKLIKEITVAARMGGGDVNANPRLRTAINQAKQANMPNDNVDRAIKKGTGDLDGIIYDEIRYEGYGPGGAAVLIECLSDNKNRITAEVRHTFSKYNGNMGELGCVAWMFDKKGILTFEADQVDSDQLFETALEAGAEDMTTEDDIVEIITEPPEFEVVQQALEAAGLKPETAEITMIPQNTIKLEDKQAVTMLKLMEAFEDNDDVQHVYANFDISDEIMAAM